MAVIHADGFFAFIYDDPSKPGFDRAKQLVAHDPCARFLQKLAQAAFKKYVGEPSSDAERDYFNSTTSPAGIIGAKDNADIKSFPNTSEPHGDRADTSVRDNTIKLFKDFFMQRTSGTVLTINSQTTGGPEARTPTQMGITLLHEGLHLVTHVDDEQLAGIIAGINREENPKNKEQAASSLWC